MIGELKIYNTLTRQKEVFEPINKDRVGMYVCGPTLYSEPHMGNMRTFINFDLIYRYLLVLGYKVKYVRNITDAGHITNSAGEAICNQLSLKLILNATTYRHHAMVWM